MSNNLTRRKILQMGLTGVLAAPLLKSSVIIAQEPRLAAAQSSGSGFRGEFYRFKIGVLNAVVLSDGSWSFPTPKAIWAPDYLKALTTEL